MVDLNTLSPEALKAAVRGGTSSWGQVGNDAGIRYCEALPKARSRRKCPCGCSGRATHTGSNNGVVLCSGCELSIRRWVRNPLNFRQCRVFQAGDAVTVKSNGRDCPGIIVEKVVDLPLYWRVAFAFGGDMPVHEILINLVTPAVHDLARNAEIVSLANRRYA